MAYIRERDAGATSEAKGSSTSESGSASRAGTEGRPWCAGDKRASDGGGADRREEELSGRSHRFSVELCVRGVAEGTQGSVKFAKELAACVRTDGRTDIKLSGSTTDVLSRTDFEIGKSTCSPLNGSISLGFSSSSASEFETRNGDTSLAAGARTGGTYRAMLDSYYAKVSISPDASVRVEVGRSFGCVGVSFSGSTSIKADAKLGTTVRNVLP